MSNHFEMDVFPWLQEQNSWRQSRTCKPLQISLAITSLILFYSNATVCSLAYGIRIRICLCSENSADEASRRARSSKSVRSIHSSYERHRLKYTEQNVALVMKPTLICFCIAADVMRKYHGLMLVPALTSHYMYIESARSMS